MTAEDAHQLLVDITPADQGNRRRTAAASPPTRSRSRRQDSAGEGTIGKLLKDDTLYQRAREIADEARR